MQKYFYEHIIDSELALALSALQSYEKETRITDRSMPRFSCSFPADRFRCSAVSLFEFAARSRER
jgi:hypothetical protein